MKIKNDKAPGINRITSELKKNAPYTFTVLLLTVFNKIFLYSEVPQAIRVYSTFNSTL